MSVELQSNSRSESLFMLFFAKTISLSKSSLSPLLFAGCLFVVTIYAFAYLSNTWVQSVYLRPGTVAAMGVNPTFDTFQGSILQKEAFQDPSILPLYGSSEMSYINKYQPARIFTPETDFTPFLVGKGGSQTLIHVLNIAALGEEARGRKLAIFLTPQWYGPGGIPELTFEGNFSPLHAYQMLRDPQITTTLKQDIAKRLLQFPGAYKDFPFLEKTLETVANPTWTSTPARMLFAFPAQMEYAALSYQDAAKTRISITELPAKTVALYNHQRGTSPSLQIDWEKIRAEAIQDGKLSSDNNPFGMDNGFYFQHIEPKLQERKDSDKNAKLFPSQEYEDLTLLMRILKEKGANPLFVIMPMNGRWSDYTGFPRSERQACYNRLAEMIQAEGFRSADFTAHESEDYYLRDPWHLAWKGWVDVNQTLDQFYKE